VPYLCNLSELTRSDERPRKPSEIFWGTTPSGLATLVTALTAPPHPAWRRTRSHLPARPFAQIKTLIPRRLSSNSLPPFSSLTLPSGTAPSGRALGRAELHAASGKNAAARTAGSYSLDASAAPSPRPSDPCVDPWAMTLVKSPAFQQVAGDLVTRRR
jgi:hypothetical protein